MEKIAYVTLVYRLSPLTTPPVEKSPMMNLTLQEILIIGSCNDQVIFDMDVTCMPLWTDWSVVTILVHSVIRVGCDF